ncbi:hypothetical protein BSKO_03385 [Bryopsis sp. KO-2023]|nr:hypothetical protein BSKO_03385 [Bryopsis sp. KO-2023]
MSQTDRFRNLVNDLTSEFSLKKKILEEQEERILQEKTKLLEEKDTMSKVRVSDGDVVHLNVGGRIFTTKRGSLRLVEGSVLELMFSGRWEDRVDRDKDGNVFMDLNPDLFDHVLRFLSLMHTYGTSARHMTLQPIAKHLEDELRLMLDHLGLMELLAPEIPFKFSPVLKSPNVTLTENLTMCHADSSRGAVRHYVLSDYIYSGGVYSLSVAVDHLEDWMMVGIVMEDSLTDIEHDPCARPGSYGWGSDGQVFVDGAESRRVGYPGRTISEGDEFQIILDCRYKHLMLKYPMGDTVLEYKIPGIPLAKWRFMVCTYYGSSIVQVTGCR